MFRFLQPKRTYPDPNIFGGPGSGNFNHSGIPGQVGGSGTGGGEATITRNDTRIEAEVTHETKRGDYTIEDYSTAEATVREGVVSLVSIHVYEPSRGQGVGTKLVDKIIEAAGDKKVTTSGVFSQDGKKLFESFVARGKAEKTADGNYIFKNTSKRAKEFADTPISGWVFNPYTRTYQNVGGTKKADTQKVRDIVAEVRQATTDRLHTLALRVQSGEEKNLAQFKTEMMEELKELYITTHVLARGGLENMEQSDWGQLGAALKDQYHYVGNLTRDLENANIGIKDENGEVIVRESGIPELGDSFLDRVDMYTESAFGARGEFENVVADRERELGSMERRVLGPSAKNCDDCIALAELDWQQPGTLPDLGDGTECQIGCNCTFEFSNEELDAAASAFDFETQPTEEEATQ